MKITINKNKIPIKYLLGLHKNQSVLSHQDMLYEIVSYLDEIGGLNDYFTVQHIYENIHNGRKFKTIIEPLFLYLTENGYIKEIESQTKTTKLNRKYKLLKHDWS